MVQMKYYFSYFLALSFGILLVLKLMLYEGDHRSDCSLPEVVNELVLSLHRKYTVIYIHVVIRTPAGFHIKFNCSTT